jgi:hypothetical protein
MVTRSPSDRVPADLTPIRGRGFMPALTFYKDATGPAVTVGSTKVTVEGQEFTYTGRTLPRLAAEVNRSLPSVSASAHIDIEPQSGELLALTDDVTPEGGTIVRFQGMAVKVQESNRIRLVRPYALSPKRAWFARINRGSVRASFSGAQFYYSIPEYYHQPWSTKFGYPYMEEYGVSVKVVSPTVLKVPHTPVLYAPGLITLRRNDQEISATLIEDVDEANGLIYLSRGIDLGDRITVDYVYEERDYVYTGLNLNPTLQHSPFVAEKFVVFYLVPTSSNTGLQNSTSVRYVVANSIEGAISLLAKGVYDQAPVLLLGAIRTRQVEEASDVAVLDARRHGGGVKDEVDPMPHQTESHFYTDIGVYDGEPYPGNSVVVMTTPRTLLTTFSDKEIREIAGRHVALGTLPIVDYDS